VPRPDHRFPADPYPGAVPPGSFVHVDGEVLALESGPWRVEGEPLDGWLARRGAVPLAQRLPLLVYGSNRNPEKIGVLRRELGLGPDPVLVLGADCRGVTAVWAAGHRARDGQRPATLAAAPGVRERHAVWMATPRQLAVLDRCEGRDERYRLVRLRTGRVVTDDGTRVDAPWCHVAHGDVRRPLLVDGARVRCADVPQAVARDLRGEPGEDGLDVVPATGAPHPDEWPSAVFAYGLLQPGQEGWHVLAPFATGVHRPATLAGGLFDTGRGYPAWRPGVAGAVRGTLVELRDPAAAFPSVDAYEGEEYRRTRVVTVDGTTAWAYAWAADVDGLAPLPGGWVARRRPG